MENYNVMFFGGLKSFFPAEMTVELSGNATAQMLIDTLSVKYPEAKNLLSISLVAVDKQVIEKTDMLKSGFKVALLPPFSGG